MRPAGFGMVFLLRSVCRSVKFCSGVCVLVFSCLAAMSLRQRLSGGGCVSLGGCWPHAYVRLAAVRSCMRASVLSSLQAGMWIRLCWCFRHACSNHQSLTLYHYTGLLEQQRVCMYVCRTCMTVSGRERRDLLVICLTWYPR